MSSNVVGLCVIRDNTVLAHEVNKSATVRTKNNLESDAKKALSTFSGNRQRTAAAGGFSLFIVPCGKAFIVAATQSSYNERMGFQLVNALAEQLKKGSAPIGSVTAAELTKTAKPIMWDLMTKYEDPAAIDKICGAQAQVDDTVKVMQNNFQLAQKRGENLDALQDTTAAMATNADAFADNAAKAHHEAKCQNYKLMAIVAGLVALIVVIIVVPVVLK